MIDSKAAYIVPLALHLEIFPDNEGNLATTLENEKTPRNMIFQRAFASDADGARTRNLWRDRPVL